MIAWHEMQGQILHLSAFAFVLVFRVDRFSLTCFRNSS